MNSNGDRLVVGSKNTNALIIYDLNSEGTTDNYYDLSGVLTGSIKSLSLNAEGDRLVIGTENNSIKVFNLTKKILEKTEDIVPLVNYYVRRKY